MIPQITKADVDAMKRVLFKRQRGGVGDNPDFKIRPISEAWRIGGRRAAYKTAVANAAYIARDSTPSDRFGQMPYKFAERRCELRGSGLILPANAPLWACDAYAIWAEADAAANATGDFTAIAAWHVMMQLPDAAPTHAWQSLATGFIERELASRGAATEWAIHALQGENGDWLVRPHIHLIVSALYWRHDRRQGLRHPAWLGSWRAQQRLERAWYRACSATGLAARHFGALRSDKKDEDKGFDRGATCEPGRS